jgi:teichuronic acid exporter
MPSKYFRDIVWQASGNALAQSVGILGIPLITRLYTPGEFAVQSLFIQLVTISTSIVTWRLEYLILLPQDRGDARALNKLVLLLGGAAIFWLTVIAFYFRESLSALMGDQSLATWIPLVPLTAVLVSWAVSIQNNAQRYGDFRNSGMSELVGRLFYVVTAIMGGLAQLGAIGLMATTAIGAIGKGVFLLLRKPMWSNGALDAQSSQIIRVFLLYRRLATQTVLAHLITTAALAAPQIAIARMYGIDALGQFALVMATIFLPSNLIAIAIGQVYYQRAAQLHSAGQSFYTLWRETAVKLALIGIPIYTLISVLSPFAYPIIFGDQWKPAGILGMIMSAAALFSFISSPMDRTCLVVGAGLYSMLWAIFRLSTTLLVIWIADALEASVIEFCIFFAVQMCISLTIDFFVGRRLSREHNYGN